MSRCQQCGRFTRGKYYPLLLILTPFALLFYTIIIVAFAYFALFEQSGGNILVGIIASIIGILIFLLPGLAVLYLLKRPKCVCDSCVQRTSQDDLGIKKHQEVDERATHQAEDDSRLPRQQVDMIVINSLLENNPAAKDIINRNSSSVTILTIPLVQSVIQATEYERTRDFEASAKIYDELLWWDEARRVRAGTI